MRCFLPTTVVAVLLIVAGCGGRDRPGLDGGTEDGATPRTDGSALDGGTGIDGSAAIDGGGASDGGTPDSGGPGLDGGPPDAGPCRAHSDCDDGDACNGASLCLEGVCFESAPPMCDDGNPCTADVCDRVLGCGSTLIDADGDGHAPSSLGATCDDCDDSRPATYAGAPDEVCNGVDDDCDSQTDEDGFVTSWPDCDGDEYAAATAVPVTVCGVPPAPPAGCTGAAAGWTDLPPGTFADCRDDNPLVFPAAGAWRSTPIPGEPPATDFDYNCNDIEWMRWTTVGSCTLNSDGSACVLVMGWETAVPDCGISALYLDTCAMSPGSGGWDCIGRGLMQPQECH